MSATYLQNLMLDVKNMRVKHVRQMFVLLRQIETDLTSQELTERLQLLVVKHGLTLGEFATGYVLNLQSRQRTPAVTEKQPRKRSAPSATEPKAPKKNKK